MKNYRVTVAAIIVILASFVVVGSALRRVPQLPQGTSRSNVALPQNQVSATTRREGETAVLIQALSQVRDEVGVLRRELAARDQMPASQDTPTEPVLDRAESIAAQRLQWTEHMAAVATDFRGEPIDERWASGTAALIREKLGVTEGMGDTAPTIECRSRSCRVEIADDGTGKIGKALPGFIEQIGGALPSVQADYQTSSSGKTVTLYMTRTSDRA